MKKQLLLAFAAVFMVCQVQAQTDKMWSPHKGGDIVTAKGVARPSFPREFKIFDLDVDLMRQELFSVNGNALRHSVIISLPNADGRIERFEVYEASNFEPELQAQYPQVRAYSGKGVTDKFATLKLSISPQGIQTMVFRTDKENEFIEAYSQDNRVYAVFKSNREKGKLAWSCSTDDRKIADELHAKLPNTNRSSAGQLKTMRLAQSCTGEYANYFGATTAGTAADKLIVMGAFNATLSRCNGVYEKDLGLHLNLIAGENNIIYCNPATDPYAAAATGLATIAGCTGPGGGADCPGTWNTQLQSTLTSVIGEANYDIGHLFGASGGGGNAGCIGCVCDALRTSNSTPTYQRGKGEGITSPADNIPQGDNFDIDYVVHEVGHQLGANHTFSMSTEGTGVNMEVGSGVTIMGYAGITSQDVAPHSIDVYHAASIGQIQTNLAGKACPVTTSITANNATPVVNAGADITIPMSTPFILTGSATDANAGDALTYSWEQVDTSNGSAAQTGANSAAAVAKAGGPNWRSYSPSSSPVRYMPTLSTVLANQLTTAGAEINVEALSSVARTLNFRLTARDNVAYSGSAPIKVGQTNFDDMVVTIDATRGPLNVTSQNVANQSWLQGSTQTVTWTVNGTNASTGGANVDILLSTDGGLTFPTVLLAGTPNDGSQTITVPAVLSTNARIMVKASASIFFNVNTTPILIGYTSTVTCNSYPVTSGLAVPDNVNTYIYVPVSVSDTNSISDVNLTVNVTHTWISDIRLSLRNPAATTEATVYSGACTGSTYDNINATFDDQGAAIVCTAPTITGTIIPITPFSAFNGQNPSGTWNVGIKDVASGDTGNLVSYTLNVCSQVFTLANNEFEFEDFALYPNPNNGDFTVKFTSASNNDIKINVHDIRGRQVYEKSFSNTGAFNQNISLDKIQSGVYLVSILDGDKKTVKRIVVE